MRQFVKEIQAGGSAAKEGLSTNGAQLAGADTHIYIHIYICTHTHTHI